MTAHAVYAGLCYAIVAAFSFGVFIDHTEDRPAVTAICILGAVFWPLAWAATAGEWLSRRLSRESRQ